MQPVQLADQLRPSEDAAHAAGLHAPGLGHAFDDQPIALDQRTAGLRIDLRRTWRVRSSILQNNRRCISRRATVKPLRIEYPCGVYPVTR